MSMPYYEMTSSRFKLLMLFEVISNKNSENLHIAEQSWYCQNIVEAVKLAKNKKEHWVRCQTESLHRCELLRWSPYYAKYQPYLIAYDFENPHRPYFTWKTIFDDDVDIERLLKDEEEKEFIKWHQSKLFDYTNDGEVQYRNLYATEPETYGGYRIWQ